jgi:hypothetical protein
MVGSCFGGLLMLIKHIKDIKTIQDLTKRTADVDFLLSIILNLFVSWGGFIGFGRPYSPACVYTLGLFIGGVIGVSLPGLFQWIEKLVMILSMLSLIIEYFCISIRYWRRTNQMKKITFFLKSILFFLIVFLFIFNCILV